MARQIEMDADMRELTDALGAAIVPRNKRRAVYSTNWHTPYYSRGRYKRI